jgi:hypothetical protein
MYNTNRTKSCNSSVTLSEIACGARLIRYNNYPFNVVSGGVAKLSSTEEHAAGSDRHVYVASAISNVV